MAHSWPEYLEELAEYLDALRRALAVGFSSSPRVPVRPDGLIPHDCAERVAQLHLDCETLMLKLSEHMADLGRRAAFAPPGPHTGRAAAYLDTDL